MRPVLVADPDPASLALVAEAAEALGHDVVRLAEVERLQEAARTACPSLVLHRLTPGTDAAGLVARLRTDTPTAEVPVVFYTGPDLPVQEVRYDAAGQVRLPLDPRRLAETLQAALDPKAPRALPDAARVLRAWFHDYRNLLAAFGNYVQVLDAARKPMEAQRALQALDELALRLEGKTDRLRAQLVAALDAVSSAPPPHSQSRPRGTAPSPPPR